MALTELLVTPGAFPRTPGNMGADGQPGHKAEFSFSSSSSSQSQPSLLKYPVLHETFLEFSGKEVTISSMPFPTLSTPLPHNHKQNGNYPRNSCTLYLKTAPPLANSHPEANLHAVPRDQWAVFKSQRARARGPGCSHGLSRSNPPWDSPTALTLTSEQSPPP